MAHNEIVRRFYSVVRRLGSTEEIIQKGPIVPHTEDRCGSCGELMDNTVLEICYSCSDDTDMALAKQEEDHTE